MIFFIAMLLPPLAVLDLAGFLDLADVVDVLRLRAPLLHRKQFAVDVLADLRAHVILLFPSYMFPQFHEVR